MKIYWSDREGKGAPSHCTFRFLPFIGKESSCSERAQLPLPVSSKVLKRTFFPSRDVWMRGVEKALALIQRKELQKVVLARTCVLELETAPDPFAIAAALQERSQGAFVFCAASNQGAFLGASPERLYARRGREIAAEAIAGTRRRGGDAAEDAFLQKQLLGSAKDLREMTPIQEYLKTTLSPLCMGPLAFSPISIHQTNNVQHLYSKCSGVLKDAATDEEILKGLHPTPALCGVPKHKAFEVIRELEPFERGLYGGAIGWSTPEASEWIVGIRSCLLQGNRATLFSGTGIVEGSKPEEEWDELNQKIKLYDGIFVDR